MADLPHIILPRVNFEEHRRTRRFPPPPRREFAIHGPAIERQVEHVVQTFQAAVVPQGLNPALIVRVQLHEGALVEETVWERSGLTLLSVAPDRTLILFSTDGQLAEFRRKLREYQRGPRDGQQNPQHAGIFACIDQVDTISPADRIGRTCRAKGFNEPEDFDVLTRYTIDVELWDFGSRATNTERVRDIKNFVERSGGGAPDTYVGDSLILIRVRANGDIVQSLLGLDLIAYSRFRSDVGSSTPRGGGWRGYGHSCSTGPGFRWPRPRYTCGWDCPVR
jgi:hypothetical protein